MSDIDDRDKLIAACRRMPGERPLVTPCCGLEPFLRDGLLWCPGMPYDPCNHTYKALAELIVDERPGAA